MPANIFLILWVKSVFLQKFFRFMEAVVIRPRTKSDIRFLLDFAKRIGVSAKTIDTEEIADARMVALIEKGLKTPSVSRSEVMKTLRQ